MDERPIPGSANNTNGRQTRNLEIDELIEDATFRPEVTLHWQDLVNQCLSRVETCVP